MQLGVFRLKAQTRVILETDDVGVFQFAEVFDVRFFLLSDLLDGNFFRVELSQEDRALSSTSQPLQLGDLLEWNLPYIYKPTEFIEFIQAKQQILNSRFV